MAKGERDAGVASVCPHRTLAAGVRVVPAVADAQLLLVDDAGLPVHESAGKAAAVGRNVLKPAPSCHGESDGQFPGRCCHSKQQIRNDAAVFLEHGAPSV